MGWLGCTVCVNGKIAFFSPWQKVLGKFNYNTNPEYILP